MKQIVQVLMSTYNGERYVKEQIESILCQEDVEIKLLIRDDGSKDATMEILKEYENRYENVTVYTGKNLGASKSFFDLIKHVDRDVEYYAFADQDDVWKKGKLKRAIYMMEEKSNEPLLYCGTYEIVNSKLEKIGATLSTNKRIISFGNALIECAYSGCTGVFNKKLLDIILKQIPEYAYMHDWWAYLVASSMGQVVWDNVPYILYRQHENNVLGGNNGWIKHILRRIRNYRNLCKYVPKQIEEFYQIYQFDLSNEQKKLIQCMLNKSKNPFKRLGIFRMKEIKRNSFVDNVIYKFMFLFWMF